MLTNTDIVHRMNTEIEYPDVKLRAGRSLFAVYSEEIGKYPVLTQEEAEKLFRKMQRGDLYAREQLITGNLRLVIKIAHDFEHLGIPFLDIINEGNYGLMRAIERYNPAKARFSTYAVWWIRRTIMNAISDKSRTIRLPKNVIAVLLRIKRTQRSLNQELGREPTMQELSEETNVSIATIRRLLDASAPVSSLQAAVQEDGSPMEDLIADTNAVDPRKALEKKTKVEILTQLIDTLSVREQAIIKSRFGFNNKDDSTHQSIGYEHSLSRERIRQIQNKIFAKLRKQIIRIELNQTNNFLQKQQSTGKRLQSSLISGC